MLEKIRKIAHHYLFKAFFLLLAVIFAASLGDFSKSTNHNIAAVVGKEKISLNEFSQARLNAIKELNQQQYLSPAQAQEELQHINQTTINKLTAQSMINQELKHLGITVPASVLAEYIHKDASFQKDGTFDVKTYKQILEYNNLTEDQLLESVSARVASKFLLDALVVNLPLKDTLANYLYDYIAEKRAVSLVTIDTSNININNSSDADLQNYYQQHPNLFQSPEYRSFKYLLLDSKKLGANLVINEADLQQEYENNKEEYALSEMRDFHHFLTPSQELADQIVNSLKATDDHLKVAQDFVSQKVIGEKFINQTSQSFLNSLNSSLFQAQENEITEAIKSELGWHVFKVVKIHPKQYKSFVDAKKEITEKLRYKALEAQIYALSKEVEDDVASGAELQDIATRHHLSFAEVKDITIDGKMDPKILNVAFQTELNMDSAITMLDNGLDLFIVKVDKITKPQLKEFSLVKDQVQKFFVAQRKDEIALEIAKLLQIEASKEDQTLVSLDKPTINKKLVSTILTDTYTKYQPVITIKNQELVRPGFARNDGVSDLLANNIFQLAPKKTSLPQKLDDAKYSFAILKNVIKPKEHESRIFQQIAELSEMNYKNAIYDQYIEYLRSKYPVEINNEIINSK